jgi:hypothetical protein
MRSRPSDCGRTNRSDEVRQNQRMASRATAGANVRPPQAAASFYRVSSWPRTGHCTVKARILPHDLITRNKCRLGTLTLHGSPSRRGHPALMASVSPTLGPFLLNEFSIVVNIDQPRIGIWGKTGSIAVPNRQLSATERSVMLPPNTGEA